MGCAVGLKTLHICLQVGDTHAGGAFHVHEWQPTGGDQAFDSAQGNTELFSGVALGYEQSSGQGRRIRRGAPRVEHEHVMTRLDAIGQKANEILDLGRYSSTFRAQLTPIPG